MINPPFRLATFNLLNKFAPYALLYPPWEKRCLSIANWAKEFNIDLLATQEGLPQMIDELKTGLPAYDVFGKPRSENPENGELAAIFVRRERLRVSDHGQFWFSETPEEPASIGWDAALARICTWVRVEDLHSHQPFYVFNVHYDHMGERARENSSSLLLKKVDAIAGDTASILTGDFNSDEEASTITMLKVKFQDPQKSSEPTHVTGKRKDYILISHGFNVHSYEIHRPSGETRHGLSDHYPVMAALSLNTGLE